jgi:hypothetical protein
VRRKQGDPSPGFMSQPDHLGHETHAKDKGHRGQDQTQPAVGFSLFVTDHGPEIDVERAA